MLADVDHKLAAPPTRNPTRSLTKRLALVGAALCAFMITTTSLILYEVVDLEVQTSVHPWLSKGVTL